MLEREESSHKIKHRPVCRRQVLKCATMAFKEDNNDAASMAKDEDIFQYIHISAHTSRGWLSMSFQV